MYEKTLGYDDSDYSCYTLLMPALAKLFTSTWFLRNKYFFTVCSTTNACPYAFASCFSAGDTHIKARVQRVQTSQYCGSHQMCCSFYFTKYIKILPVGSFYSISVLSIFRKNKNKHFVVSVHGIVPQHFRCLASASMSFNAFLRAWLLPSPAFEG